MKGSIYVFLALLIALLIPGADLAVFPAKQTEAQPLLETVTLKLKWKHQFQFAGYYAAIEQGYYRDAGLDVRIEEAVDQEASEEAVLSGQAEFGIASSDLVVLRGKGKPVVVLAVIFQHSASGLLVQQGTGIESIHDLIGKRIMLEPHSEEILAYMQAEGINSQEMILYPHTFDPQPLIDGNVDAMSAYITDEPFLLDNAGLSYRFYSPRSGGIDFYGDTLFTSEEVINQHPEMVAAFLRASLRGWVYAFQNEDAAIDLILSKYSSRHSREHLKYEADQMRNLVLPDVVEIGYISPARWERIGETYVDLGILEQKPDLSGFIYDPSMKQGINWIYMFAGALFTIVAMLLMLGVASGLKIIVTQWRKTKISGRKP